MPSEVRHLLFRTPEVVHAVQSHFRRQGKPLGSGLVGDCTFTGDGIGTPIIFQLRLHTDMAAGQAYVVDIDSINLVAALIMHCREKQIPLPAKAAKSLQKVGEQICLVATLG